MSLSPAETLERTQWDTFWAPPYVHVVDRPELKVLHSERDVTFGNCVVRLRAPVAQIPALLAEVRALHPVRSRFLVTDTWDTGPLVERLPRHGYAPASTYEVRTLPTAGPRPPLPDGLSVVRVTTLAQLRDVYRVSNEAFDVEDRRSESDLEGELARCASPDGRVFRFAVYDGDAPVCAGGLNRYDDLGFGFLWAGGTVPGARGRGAYTALVTARVRWARQLGLHRVGLYAKVDTSAPILARQGFERGGTMSYWDRA